MFHLRHARLLARLVLVWFVLAVGVAVASPLVKPQSLALVCSGAGALKILVTGDADDASLAGAGLLDCPLCLQGGAPPPATPVLAYGLAVAAALPFAPPWPDFIARAAGPLPGRGPPVHS